MTFITALLAAVVLDLLIGDPPCYPHPVRLIGQLISFYENLYRRLISQTQIAGMCTVVSVLLTVFFVVFQLLNLLSLFSPYAESIAVTLILYTCIAIKDLRFEAKMVHDVLQTRDIVASRKQVGRIVGRDTSQLSEEGIIKATVETVAENLSDGVIAPIFWAICAAVAGAILGANPLVFAAYGAITYKAINTMDSMIGYKNEKYLFFGKSAAYLDDYVNFIPARITGFIIVILAFLLGKNGKLSLEIFLRDRLKHTSPNAGHPEAAIAGLLGVELCGPSVYFGQIVDKPTIGNKVREILKEDIILTNKIALLSLVLFLFLFLTPCYFLPI